MLPSLTLIPPSPVTDKILLDIRGAIRNTADQPRTCKVALFLDRKDTETRIHQDTISLPAQSYQAIRIRWPTADLTGRHTLILSVQIADRTYNATATVNILASPVRSTRRIGGAWAGIVHWSEKEGKRWNTQIRALTDSDWRDIVRAMHEIQMNIIVIQEVFRNQMYHGAHRIKETGYNGKAFYPSRLYPGRMDIAAHDPVEAILSEADRQGMRVFLGVGLYAWFDFTPGSLEWHKKVASELWRMYGHHPSFYGWYISEEVHGSIVPIDSKEPEDIARYRREIVEFFRGFRAHCHQFAPDKPIMLAPNCYYMQRAENTWRQLLQSCDIICPFGFHRMRPDDVTGQQAAAWLQQLCDQAGAHLWMDLEVFLFGSKGELYPRPIDGLVNDLVRFPTFEKILCYQYPGLLNAPWAKKQPGGPATVELFLNYKTFEGIPQ